MPKRLFDLIFRDKAGKVVIFQAPNTAIITYVALVIIGWFLPSGLFRNIERVLAFVALGTWALMEIISGASLIRRIAGGVVLIASIIMAALNNGLLHKLL